MYVCLYVYIYIYIYVCICLYVHICVYILCTFVYLYLIVYNWFKSRLKHVCIFLHSFIFWQIDTYYWLTLGTFKRNGDISWRIPCRLGYSRKKKSKQGQSWRTGEHFRKTPGILGLSLYLWKLTSREKKGSSQEILQNCGTLFLWLGNFNKAKNQDPMESPYDFFLII